MTTYTGTAVSGTPGITAASTIAETALSSTATGTGTSAAYAGYFNSSAKDGVNTHSTSTSGCGVFSDNYGGGPAIGAESNSGTNPTVSVVNSNTSGIGITVNMSATSGVGDSTGIIIMNSGVADAYAIECLIENDNDPVGVDALCGATAAAKNASAITGGTSGTTANNCYAGTFVGAITKTGGTFLIDHPLDPTNKWLAHSFVESPDMMNVYNGVASADQAGEIAITMPTYFSTLNENYRYQLTPLGVAAPNLHVKEEMRGNIFAIGGAIPGQRVSWQVTGVRQDAWAKQNPVVVEREKQPKHKGLYQHPEAYGEPDSKGIMFARRERARKAAQAPGAQPRGPSSP